MTTINKVVAAPPTKTAITKGMDDAIVNVEEVLHGLLPDLDYNDIVTAGSNIFKAMDATTKSITLAREAGKEYRKIIRANFDDDFVLKIASQSQADRKDILKTKAGIPFAIINDNFRTIVKETSSAKNKDANVNSFNSNLSRWIGYLARDIIAERAEQVRQDTGTDKVESLDKDIAKETNKDKKAKLRKERNKLESDLDNPDKVITKVVQPVSDKDRRDLILSYVVKIDKVLGEMNNLTQAMKILKGTIRAAGTLAFKIKWEAAS